MRRKREEARAEEFVQVAERLRPYVGADFDDGNGYAAADPPILDEIMQRAVTLLTVMPRHQRRETIESLVSPYDPERGQRAVDALVDADLVTVDEAGFLHRRQRET